jgi:hypothetical protein
MFSVLIRKNRKSTAAGLVVAIGTLLFANLFRGLYKRQLALIQEYGGQLEILYETHYERQSHLKEEAYAMELGIGYRVLGIVQCFHL